MISMYRWFAIALLLTGIYAAGWYKGYGRVVQVPGPIVTVEKIVYKDKVVTKVVEKIVTKKPDGTVVTEEREKDTDRQVDSNSNRDKTLPPLKDRSLPNYMAGVGYRLDSIDRPREGLIEGKVGRRLFGEFWIEAGFTKKDASLGLTYRWE